MVYKFLCVITLTMLSLSCGSELPWEEKKSNNPHNPESDMTPSGETAQNDETNANEDDAMNAQGEKNAKNDKKNDKSQKTEGLNAACVETADEDKMKKGKKDKDKKKKDDDQENDSEASLDLLEVNEDEIYEHSEDLGLTKKKKDCEMLEETGAADEADEPKKGKKKRKGDDSV